MLKKLKKALKTLLGVDEKHKVIVKITPAAKPEEKRKNHPAKTTSQRKSREKSKEHVCDKSRNCENRSAKREKPKRERSERPVQVETPDTPKAPKLEHPATLKDVPVVEGKLRFLDLPLHEEVQFGIQHAGFEYCTPIQALALPALLENRDLAGKAQTGTGTTAAFLLATFTRFLNNPLEGERKAGQPRALVLAPTRELAMQIHKDAELLGVFTGLNSVVVFGGMDHEKQRRTLTRPVDLVIGTPGRIIDYSRGGDLDLSKVEVLVIDEADRMLDMGFIPDVKRIVAQLPKKGKRQTLLFSATLEDHILRFTADWLAEPVIFESEPEKMVSENIEQTFFSVLRDEKLSLLLHILRSEKYDRVLIFGNRKDVNLRLQYDLSRFGYSVPVLSGDIPQDKRIKILEKFRSGAEKIVIATDVAARGIHVDDVSLVINYDLPERAEDYVHRIGRTGRAGNLGKSISFLCEYGAYFLPDIEKLLNVQFPSTQPTDEMLQMPEPIPGAKPAKQVFRRGVGGGSGGQRGGFRGRSATRKRR
ncbi:MAG: DEAD/DEAH box helicase [Victivallales bacterium]|nr:DEAD/DEAH box helicase [Victivallales bacterium]